VKKLTPVIFVEEIEPSLPFWTDRLGFSRTTEVPEGDKLGFVILSDGNTELMYQSRASVVKDLPAQAGEFQVSRTNLFIEVERLDDFKSKLAGVPVIIPERTTFYGSREIGVRAPCGTAVILAQFGDQ
jgi:uncharacterized glyoxalase superfamily protein PhnB